MFDIEKTLIPVFITATLLTVMFLFFLIAALVRLKDRKTKKEHNSLRTAIEEKERIMYTISVEIHNNINQVLSLNRMALNMIDKFAVPEQKKYILESGNMLDSLIADLRNISHSLNSDYLKKRGLHEVLEEEANWLNITQKINCNLEVEGMFCIFTPDTELIIIRIAQEVIQNTLKHAQAQKLHIYLEYGADQFIMSIKDDGKGFNLDPEKPLDGMGLQSIYNRSRIIDGHIKVESEPGAGTTIVLILSNPAYMEKSTNGD